MRVLKYVINVVPQVRGRVIEVPVEPNRLVKKGEVLFKIDPTPYQIQMRSLEASLANAQGNAQKTREDLDAAVAKTRSVNVNLALAKTRVGQNAELVSLGAGDRFTLESAQTDVKRLEADLASSQANEAAIRAQAKRDDRRRPGGGRRSARAARAGTVGTRSDDAVRAGRRLRDQRTDPPGDDDGGVSGDARHDVRRSRISGHRAVRRRTNCT